MRYIKVLFLVVLFFVVMMFFVQNQTSFSAPVTLKLDMFFLPTMESIPFPLYALMLMCFAIGAILVLSMLVWDRMTLSGRLMSTRYRANGLEKQLAKLEAKLAIIDEKHTIEINKLQIELHEAEKRLETTLRSS